MKKSILSFLQFFTSSAWGLVSFWAISLTKLETCFMRLPLLPLSAVASI